MALFIPKEKISKRLKKLKFVHLKNLLCESYISEKF